VPSAAVPVNTRAVPGLRRGQRVQPRTPHRCSSAATPR
jgi:hypothetical protein